MLGLIVGNALGPIKLGQAGFNFGSKYEPFNGIVDGCIWRHRLESLDNAVAGKWLRHSLSVIHVSLEMCVFSCDLGAGRKIVP